MGRMLVVDDNRDLGKLTSEILKERGFRVNIAFNGESALAKAKKHRYDLMLLDYKLPGISGLTVLEKIHKIRPSLRTIMISAFGTESIRLKAKELGAYAFLDKPFDIDELVRIIKKSLREQKRRCVNEADLQSRDSSSSSNDCGSSSFSSGESRGSNQANNSVRASKILVG